MENQIAAAQDELGERRVIAIRREFIELGGDHVVAVLLSQIHYWYAPAKNGKTKLRVQRHGHLWIAKTREQWMAETGLTLKRYRRAIAVLKQKGLVEVKQMLFAGKAMSHIRLLNP